MSSSTDTTVRDEWDDDEVVQIEGGFDVDGTPMARAVLTPDSDKRRKEVLVDPRPPIPVIFLPGVMGSLLANKDSGQEVWSPPNLDEVASAVAGVISVVAGWFASATQRAARFDPVPAVVDPRGPINVEGCGLTEAEARRRGWGTVHRWSYHPTLAWLEHTLSRPMRLGVLRGEWINGDPEGKDGPLKPILGTDPSGYGAFGPGGAITTDDEVFKTFVSYRYPVYAIGYNFLQSNELSAQQVLDGVEFRPKNAEERIRILGIRQICRENHTDKAILITHSMGGLVARMASVLCSGADDILGVVHGVQPATGAPLFAKRFRTGGEGFIDQSLMGRDDAEFVAIASNAEGPMELSPMPDYNEGKPWWVFVDKKDGREILALPENGRTADLYTNQAWYGLLPDISLLDPAGIVKRKLEKEGSESSVFQDFCKRAIAVYARQKNLENSYHPNTYAIYGDGRLGPAPSNGSETPDKLETGLPEEDLQTWGRVVWQGDFPVGVTADDLKAAKLIRDDHQGEMTLLVRGQVVKLTVQRKAVAPKPGERDNGIISGDGTVPSWSAAAQGRGLVPGQSHGHADGVQMVFVQGGYDHQFSFKHPWSKWATLYSVAKIAHALKSSIPNDR